MNEVELAEQISREWIGGARSIGRGSESSVLIEPLLMDVTNDSECTIFFCPTRPARRAKVPEGS
jgi:hypothetical protein